MTLHLTTFLLRLALGAALCMVALQAVELSHQHTGDGSAAHCLVCKSGTDIAPLAGLAPNVFTAQLLPRLFLSQRDAVVSPFFHFYSRGPPALP